MIIMEKMPVRHNDGVKPEMDLFSEFYQLFNRLLRVRLDVAAAKEKGHFSLLGMATREKGREIFGEDGSWLKWVLKKKKTYYFVFTCVLLNLCRATFK